MESRIHFHPMAPSAIGATHGRRIKKRMKPRPRKVFSKAIARILAPTMTTILRADGEYKGIADGDAEAGTLQDAAKIFHANIMHFGVADTGVTESIKNGQEKRSGNQQQDI